MAKKAMVLKQQRSKSSPQENTIVAKSVADLTVIFASTVFAVSASVNSLTADKSQA